LESGFETVVSSELLELDCPRISGTTSVAAATLNTTEERESAREREEDFINLTMDESVAG
jgi:phage FluMu protein Com